jgi:hypothetical protein
MSPAKLSVKKSWSQKSFSVDKLLKPLLVWVNVWQVCESFSFQNVSRLHLLVSFPVPHEEIEVVCHCLSYYRPSFIDVAQQLFESVRQIMRKNELSSINIFQRFYSSVCVHLARTRSDPWTTKCTVPKTQKVVLRVQSFLNRIHPSIPYNQELSSCL